MKSHKLIKNPTISGKCVLVLLILIFCLTMTTFVMNEFRNSFASDNSTILRVLMNSDSKEKGNSTKFLLINVEQKNDLKDFVPTKLIDSTRIVRQANNSSENSPKNYYYEEQQPVVVHAESALPVMNYNMAQSAKLAQNILRNGNDDSQRTYYADDENTGDDYADSSYYDGDFKREFFDNEYEAGRSSQDQQNNFNDWHYSPWPLLSKNIENSAQAEMESKNNQMDMERRHPSYPSYNDDTSDYEYPMGFVRGHPANMPKNQINQELQQQIQQQGQARIPDRQQSQFGLQPKQQQQIQSQGQTQKQLPQKQQMQTQQPNTEPTLLSVVKGLKTMWDIYQAFSSAWNTIAEHRQKQEDALREKLRQQQRTRIRVNSRKPPKFGNNSTSVSMGNSVAVATTAAAATQLDDIDKNNKDKSLPNSAEQGGNKSKVTTQTTRIRSTRAPKPKISATKTTSTTGSSALAKVEPRRNNAKGDRRRNFQATSLRKRRDSTETTAMAEGRYIKGDPLKGYYDFVITEGSYKFWAIFQTGTAILIIYSVFAAIYYSKVNPLVSDYDYTDYLGGARSMTGGDMDFVDDESDDQKQLTASNWYADIIPKVGHSVKFILDAIDKLPAEPEEYDAQEENEHDYEESNYPSNGELQSSENNESSEITTL